MVKMANFCDIYIFIVLQPISFMMYYDVLQLIIL